MTVWCTTSTIFKQRLGLLIAGLLTLSVALTTTLFLGHVSFAAPGVNQTINFQGRLQYPTGGVVADGHYNMQFKLYAGGDGQSSGNSTGSPSSTLLWTESRINNGGTAGVEVKNGYFTVDLGSVTAFSGIDWNDDKMWLSMNIAGSATACTTFGSSPCTADGEMLPMQRLTSVPFALNSNLLGGKTASNFVQLAQGVQTDASTNTSSIFINKTGSGNLLQLQNTAADILTIKNNGDLSFGANDDHLISIDTAAASTTGNVLTVRAGTGGSGSGNNGGDLNLQGGAGGGSNANGGWVNIDAGTAAGGGNDGSIQIGNSHAGTIALGSNWSTASQIINIGTNNTSGSTTNVTIGSGGSASGGTTAIQSKNDTTVATNGTQRARFSGSSDTLYVGNADNSGNATTANSFTIQGTNSTGSNAQGGSLTLQAGAATGGNANGGNITISGGAGVGTGATGLVVINTPTFQTTTSDANCYTSGAVVASSCTITTTSVNNSAAVIIGFSASGKTATLPDPTITTAGRVLYVTAASGSSDFTLSFNAGGIGNRVTLRQNATATMIWNGSDWTAAGASNSTTLQSSYDNSVQAVGDPTFLINATNSVDGLVVRNSEADQVGSSLFQVQTAAATSLFSVNGLTEYAKNGGAETAGSSSSTFPSNTWVSGDGATVSRYTTAGNNIGSGTASVQTVTSGVWSGAMSTLSTALIPGHQYTVSFAGRTPSGTMSDIFVYYSYDNTASDQWCTDYNYIDYVQWREITCTFTVPAVTVLSSNSIYIGSETDNKTFYIDNLSVTENSTTAPSVRVGSNSGGPATLFTLDSVATAPSPSDWTTILGSMYYDTTLGKVQCYEQDGWGRCSNAPDVYVNLSPEYANAVMNGADIGTISSDLCSDTLNINDGSSSQPTICGTNETRNFYKWTSSEATDQTRSIYISYQLPSDFKNFIAGSVSLMGRTDSADSSVSYQIYKDHSGNALSSCGSSISVSTGSQSTWQTVAASGGSDPSSCTFAAGDSVLIRVNLTAKNSTNAYVSNLKFTYSSNN